MFEVEAEYRVWVKVPLKIKVAEVELDDAGLFKVLTESSVSGDGKPTTATNCYKNFWDATLSYELLHDLDGIAYNKDIGKYIDYEYLGGEDGEVTDFYSSTSFDDSHLPDHELLKVKTTNFSLEDYSRNS